MWEPTNYRDLLLKNDWTLVEEDRSEEDDEDDGDAETTNYRLATYTHKLRGPAESGRTVSLTGPLGDSVPTCYDLCVREGGGDWCLPCLKIEFEYDANAPPDSSEAQSSVHVSQFVFTSGEEEGNLFYWSDCPTKTVLLTSDKNKSRVEKQEKRYPGLVNHHTCFLRLLSSPELCRAVCSLPFTGAHDILDQARFLKDAILRDPRDVTELPPNSLAFDYECRMNEIERRALSEATRAA